MRGVTGAANARIDGAVAAPVTLGLFAVIGDDCRQRVDQAKPLVGTGQQQHAAVGTDQATVECRGDFLLQQFSFCRAGGV